jgi:sporulation protein YlmC with PRC-barrel domain
MKRTHWPRHLALTAIGALFALPMAHAQYSQTDPVAVAPGVTIPRAGNTLDIINGNDTRDVRDSTILRNDVNFDEPMPGNTPNEPIGGLEPFQSDIVQSAAVGDGMSDSSYPVERDAAARFGDESVGLPDTAVASADTGTASDAQVDGGTAAVESMSAADRAAFQHMNRASTLIGTPVRDAQGREIGQVREIVLDPAHGRITYAVVAFDPAMGHGSRVVAVPWSALTPASGAQQGYTIRATEQQIRSARGFEANQWPSMGDERWHNETYDHFGQTPYWRDLAAGPGSTRGAGGGPGAGGAGAGGGAAGGGGGAAGAGAGR